MGALIENPTPVQTLALGIIDSIETFGHFQAKDEFDHGDWGPGENPQGPCCLVSNPFWEAAPWTVQQEFRDAFVAAAGTLPDPDDRITWLPAINDALSTDEVLDALWAVALGS